MTIKSWMIGHVTLVAVCLSLGSMAKGQFSIQADSIFDSSQGYYYQQSYGNNNQQMIWDNQVLQAELELTRNQRRELLDLKLDYDERVGHHRLKMQQTQAKIYRLVDGKHELDKDAQQRLAELQRELMKMREEANEKVEEVLLPHQRKLKMRREGDKVMSLGLVRFLMAQSIQRQLNIDNETKQRVREKIKDLEARFQSQMAEMVQEAHEELLDELDGKTRSIVEEMLDQYEYAEKANGISLTNYDRYFMRKRKEKSEDEE